LKKYFKILVASDYSKAGDNAVRYAIQLAKSTNSFLTFFHSFEESFHFPEQLAGFEKLDENPVKPELTDLKEYITDIFLSMDMKFEESEYRYMVRQGALVNELYAEAERDNTDLIILGTHEADLIRTAVKGSHTWEAIKNTPIPVLAIPEEAFFENIKHIVFATEYRKGEIPVINFLKNLAIYFKAELSIFHVYNDVFSQEFENELFERFKGEVTGLMDHDTIPIQLVHNNDLAEGLNSFCAKVNATWLVMSHEKTTFPISLLNPMSVTKKMSSHTYLPLLVVPDAYTPKHQVIGTPFANGHT